MAAWVALVSGVILLLAGIIGRLSDLRETFQLVGWLWQQVAKMPAEPLLKYEMVALAAIAISLTYLVWDTWLRHLWTQYVAQTHPLSLASPHPISVYSQRVSEGGATVYKNTSVIEVANISADVSIRNLKAQIFALERQSRLPKYGSADTYRIRLDPGDHVSFEIGYVYTKKAEGVVDVFQKANREAASCVVTLADQTASFYVSREDGVVGLNGLNKATWSALIRLTADQMKPVDVWLSITPTEAHRPVKIANGPVTPHAEQHH